MFGLGARNENGGSDDEIHAPEFLMSGDVLRWDSARTFGESRVVARGLIGSEFAFGMCKQVCTVAIQNEHEQQLCV